MAEEDGSLFMELGDEITIEIEGIGALTSSGCGAPKITGLHRNDFIMAAKTDELYQP